MITIQNTVGGNRLAINSAAVLARVAATQSCPGGYAVVDFTGVEDLSLDDCKAVLRSAEYVTRFESQTPRSADDWRKIARLAIKSENDLAG